MVVVGSRKEAVRWQKAIDKYIKEQGYPSARWWRSRAR
jgi:type I restriction enzyme R subunit